jgi:hypothetical protein
MVAMRAARIKAAFKYAVPSCCACLALTPWTGAQDEDLVTEELQAAFAFAYESQEGAEQRAALRIPQLRRALVQILNCNVSEEVCLQKLKVDVLRSYRKEDLASFDDFSRCMSMELRRAYLRC